MRIALTGATGFVGRYIADALLNDGHTLQCWKRAGSDLSYFANKPVEWVEGELNEESSTQRLIHGSDALVHAALWRPGAGFRGSEGDLGKFAERNIIGSLRLFEAALENSLKRVVFVSTCAVHERVLEDRPLDETHPTWAKSHYGAHKAAIENFVHSFAMGHGLSICALRPTGVYGIASPIETSKWYKLIRDVVHGFAVECQGGGKEVNAADVAKAIALLVTAPNVSGEIYSCYDRYVSQYEVAQIAKEISGSKVELQGEITSPKHQIVTDKLQTLGMEFGGTPLLRRTIELLVQAARSRA